MNVDVPESVYAYFTDRRIRSAVDLLLSKGRPKVPEDIGWAELPAFYRAVAAARQTQSDLAVFLHEFWTATWEDMPRPWQAEYPSGAGQNVDMFDIWDNDHFTRTFKRDGMTCELSVYLDGAEEGIQIGFELLRGNRSLVKTGDMQGWEQDSNCFWSPENELPFSRCMDLKKLEGFVSKARDVIAEKAELAR